MIKIGRASKFWGFGVLGFWGFGVNWSIECLAVVPMTGAFVNKVY